MTEFNYMKDLEIDLNALPEVCQTQPILYMKYSEMAISASEEKDAAKNAIDSTKAVIDAEVRAFPHKFGWTDSKKPTETFIENAVILDERYQKAVSELSEKTKVANLLASAVRAFDQRRYMIGHEVSMFIGGFFGEVESTMSEKTRERINNFRNDK